MLSPNWPEISSGRIVLLTNIESLIRDSGIEVRNLFSYEIVSSLVYMLQLLRLLYLWMHHIFGKMQIAYRKRHKFAFMLWNIFFEWLKLQIIHGYNVGCFVVTECACFVYYDIIIYSLSGCFRSDRHHPTEKYSRLCFKLYFLGNNIPKNEKEEKWRRRTHWAGRSVPFDAFRPATSTLPKCLTI